MVHLRRKVKSPLPLLASDYPFRGVNHGNERRRWGYKVAGGDAIVRHLSVFAAASSPASCM